MDSYVHFPLLYVLTYILYYVPLKHCCRVSFEFQHNVCGRSIYAEGTVDAVLFLAKKVLIYFLDDLTVFSDYSSVKTILTTNSCSFFNHSLYWVT